MSRHVHAAFSGIGALRGMLALALTMSGMLALALTMGGLLALCASASAAAATSTLSPKDYTVHPLCTATPAPAHAGCLGLTLDPTLPSRIPGARPRAAAKGARAATGSPAAKNFSAPWPQSLSANQLLEAYNLPSTPASPQTLAIVDAYDDATAEADLATYSKTLLGASAGPPACTIATNGEVGDPAKASLAEGCFLKVNQQGHGAPLPTSKGSVAEGWAGEIATDIELAHGLCRSCRILLVEAEEPSYGDLEAAENTAASMGAGEISNSWGGPEPPVDSDAFEHHGVAITASAGDNGYLNWDEQSTAGEPESPYFEEPDYPASSPHVVAVGGTTLEMNRSTGAWTSETAWNNQYGAGGGGCSRRFGASQWQTESPNWSVVGCGGMRAVTDVSADADPFTGVAVYDSTPNPSDEGNTGWGMIGGTSVASPIVASVFALAGGARNTPYPAETLYSHLGASSSASLHDITAGGNGECTNASHKGGCAGSLNSPLDCGPLYSICNAATGYDGPTGVGSPNGIGAFQPADAGQQKSGEGTGGSNGGSKGSGEGAGGSGATEGNGSGTAGGAGTNETASGGTSGLNNGLSAGAAGSGAGDTSLNGANSASAGERGKDSGAHASLSALALTPSAILALNRSRPIAAEVSFAFTLSAATRVRVTLAKQVRVRGHTRWRQITPDARTIQALAGRDRGRLTRRRALTPGRYRLTVTPLHGLARSIDFLLG
jgi:hypothetical protein